MWNEKRKIPKVGSIAFYNLKEGRTFCEWGSDGQDTLKRILKECKLPCEEMVEVINRKNAPGRSSESRKVKFI